MKFRVKDDDGRDYVVEELVEENVIPPETVEDDDETLSAEEIKGLRELLAHGPQLLALLKEEHEEHAEDACEEEEIKDEDEEEEKVDEDEIVEDEDVEEEKILETKSHDSKKAFGSIEQNKKTYVDDSLTDNVSDAWAKRYNGGKR